MKYGYGRISTVGKNQKLDRQLKVLMDNVEGLSLENIYTDKITGTVKDRSGLNELKSKLQAGDELWVESLSRLSRSTQDLLEQISEFSENGIIFHSIKENFDFSSATGKLLLSMIAAIVAFERDLIAERVKEGVEVARIKGKRIGRPPVSQEKLDNAIKLYNSGSYSVKVILEMVDIGKTSFYQELKKIRDKEMLENEKGSAIL